MLKTLVSHRWFHPLLLLAWIAIGTGLRFHNLAGKPPWTDEFATMVFSLGNSYHTVPLNQAISLDTLLSPLRPNPAVGVSATIHHLITEDHHPPLYFILAHWWLQLFPASGGYISLWAARSLPALFGVASIPAIYGLSLVAFRQRLVAQLAAAMMAVSPYGIFLAQEARHYALGIIWVIASLCCLVIAMQHLKRQVLLPIGMVLGWVVVNSLGMATHYFFSLTLCAEAIVLTGFWLLGSRFAPALSKFLPIPHSPFPIPQSHWSRIYAVAAGTLVGCLVWVPVWQSGPAEEMTQWIKNNPSSLLTWINPIFQALATWITMLSLLPVEASSLLLVIVSGAIMLVFFIWATPKLYRGLKVLLEQSDSRLATRVLGGFVLGAIAIFFGITYILGADITRGARYNFVYFPAVIVLVGAALAIVWNSADTPNAPELLNKEHAKSNLPSRLKTGGKPAVAIVWLMGLLSGITVVNNLGYQKYYRPDLLVPAIQQTSSIPVLLATTHNTLVQTGEMMGIAWEFQHANASNASAVAPQFLLAHQNQEECDGLSCPAYTTLRKTLAQLPRPLDLWLINFKAPVEPEAPNCFAEDVSQYQTSVNGYKARLYHCLAADSQAAQRP
ncbi:MAG TPA: glycosyltransferase family 39 protein [Allocoleopsis sp.]